MSFQDHFSGHADAYQAYRPTYPASLFAALAAVAPGRARAWDVGCGNGQAAVALADHFAGVDASDPSARQIASAATHPQVRYHVEPAEKTRLADASVDLVTVAQALHWFDLERFYDEVRRVARPGGVIAAWTYVRSQITPAVDAVIDDFYHGPVNPYWPQDRQKVEAGYRGMAFPFMPVDLPPIIMEMTWTSAQVAGYVGTWSAVQRYRAATGNDPMPALVSRLEAAWGAPAMARPVRWPLSILCGRVER
jgi:SAM-dependent methyltransferase